MASPMISFHLRLPPEHIAWLDRQVQGPVSSRGAVLRHLINNAIERTQSAEQQTKSVA